MLDDLFDVLEFCWWATGALIGIALLAVILKGAVWLLTWAVS